VIGPNGDSEEILKGNYNGTATEKYTILEGIRAVLGKETRIFCSEGSHLYRDNVENLAEADDRLRRFPWRCGVMLCSCAWD
jgi:beta-glucosidase